MREAQDDITAIQDYTLRLSKKTVATLQLICENEVFSMCKYLSFWQAV